MQDHACHKNLLYNIFVPTLMKKQNEMTTNQTNTLIDIAVEVHHEKLL